MGDIVTTEQLQNARVDVENLAQAINDDVVVTPRYGDPYKSIPRVSREIQEEITALKENGMTTDAVIDSVSKKTQKQINDEKLNIAQSLGDLQDKSAARTNLDVYSKGAVDNATAQATETTLGTAKIATTAQATELTNDTTFLTPLKYKTSAKTLFNASGNAPMFACRAWVNFSGVPLNGTYSQAGTTVTVTMTAHGMSVGQLVNLSITSGTAVSGNYPVATVIDANTFTYTAATSLTTSGNMTRNLFIRASGNVLSVTDNGVGDWTINFAKALPSANYAPLLSVGDQIAGNASIKVLTAGGSAAGPLVLKTASACRIGFGAGSSGVDATEVSAGFIV